MGKKKLKKKKKDKLRKLSEATSYKSKCCNKYKKGPNKRCKKCPCFDLFDKVA